MAKEILKEPAILLLDNDADFFYPCFHHLLYIREDEGKHSALVIHHRQELFANRCSHREEPGSVSGSCDDSLPDLLAPRNSQPETGESELVLQDPDGLFSALFTPCQKLRRAVPLASDAFPSQHQAGQGWDGQARGAEPALEVGPGMRALHSGRNWPALRS